MGSVFSPYYAWSGRQDPDNHCAINVALYGRPGARWAMTERGADRVCRARDLLRVGPSVVRWDGSELVIDVDEICAPVPKRICGQIRITPRAYTCQSFALDAATRHWWQPIAPRTRVEVNLSEPDLRWSGEGYLDSNRGDEPLEAGFQNWTWSRSHGTGGAVVLYDAVRRDGSASSLALRIDNSGTIRMEDAPPRITLPSTYWRINRETRADECRPAIVRKTLEDTPFYARSLVESHLFGERAMAFHESLRLDRFQSQWVRLMLPFRMPRALW